MIKKEFPLEFQWATQEPFLFCVHHHDFFPKGDDELGVSKKDLIGREIGSDFEIKDGFRMYHGETVPGFPSHPHRGFETITIVREGFVDHADSLGAAGRYGQGDVQWMTAGRGVQHSEMFPLLNKDKDNTLELFQIWLNLPRKNKLVEPHFKMLWSEEIPKLSLSGNSVQLSVIAGSYGVVRPPSPPPDSWASDPENDVQIWLLKMASESSFTIPKGKPLSRRGIYFFNGKSLILDGRKFTEPRGFFLDAAQDLVIEAGEGDPGIEVLILQAKPIGEPVFQHGPFVMTTRDEIIQTFQEYQSTRFGGWNWPRNDMVHGKEIRRFAQYPDGSVVTRGSGKDSD